MSELRGDEMNEERIAGLTRREFLALPMKERHKRLEEQAKEFVKNHGYLPDGPTDGHSTMIEPKSSPVLGETVLNKEQRDEVYESLTGDYTVGDERKAYCVAQDSYTRKCLKGEERGWLVGLLRHLIVLSTPPENIIKVVRIRIASLEAK